MVGSRLRAERDEAVRQHTDIDSRVNDLQVGKDTPPTDPCKPTNLFICCIKCCNIKLYGVMFLVFDKI